MTPTYLYPVCCGWCSCIGSFYRLDFWVGLKIPEDVPFFETTGIFLFAIL
jgi:hypothetical protein